MLAAAGLIALEEMPARLAEDQSKLSTHFGAIANLIRKGDLHMLPSAIQSGREAGMIPLERSLAKLLDAGTVAPQAVKRIAADHDLLSALSAKLR